MELWDLIAHDSGMILAFFTFSVSIYFLNKLRKVRKTTREILPFVGIIMICLTSTISFFVESWRIILKLVTPVTPELNILLYGIQFLSVLGAVGFFVFLAEYVAKRMKYVFSIYALIEVIIGIYLTATASDTNILAFYSIFASVPLVFGALILWYFVFVKPNTDLIRRRMIITMVGLIIIAAALILRSRLGDILFGGFSRLSILVGNCVAITGVFCIWYSFSSFSTLSDLNWRAKLREIFVISNKGIALYAFSFDQNEPLQDSDLIAGGFSGIQSILSEMVKTKEDLNLINYQNLKILVEQTADLMFVLVLKEESAYLQYKLQKFSGAFQNFFKDVLASWEGQIDIFIPTKSLIQDTFELESASLVNA